MNKIIAACGNDCSICPRHLPKTDEELYKTSELWHRIGYRDKVVSIAEISCSGCSPNNWCRYKIIDCTMDIGVANCGECSEYPCEKIRECFDITDSFRPTCKEVCNSSEYEILKKAFFQKESNLDSIYENGKIQPKKST